MKKEFNAKAAVSFNEEFKKIFEKHPLLNSFSFGCWTDYFNDGDTCNFYLREHVTKVNGYKIDLEDLSYCLENDESVEAYYKANPWIEDSLNECWALLHSIPNDFYESVFEDHIIVTVNRDGTTKVEDYSDHD